MATPMYRVIAEQLRQQIETREFEAGKQLPTEQELQERYGASRNTIRDAIKQLITLGLVETRPGQGTSVIAHGTSTGSRGPWRHRSIRVSSRTSAPRSSARPATSTRERSGTCRTASASVRSATATGSPYAHRTQAKWTSSRCRQTAEWPWWKIHAPPLTATSDPCA